MRESASVLEDVRVVDLSQALAGPYCTMLLGDLGANVEILSSLGYSQEEIRALEAEGAI